MRTSMSFVAAAVAAVALLSTSAEAASVYGRSWASRRAIPLRSKYGVGDTAELPAGYRTGDAHPVQLGAQPHPQSASPELTVHRAQSAAADAPNSHHYVRDVQPMVGTVSPAHERHFRVGTVIPHPHPHPSDVEARDEELVARYLREIVGDSAASDSHLRRALLDELLL